MNIEEIKLKMNTLCDFYGYALDELTYIGKVTESDVDFVERKYKVLLPLEYRRFVSEYGGWSLNFELFGIVPGDSLYFEAMDITNQHKTDIFPIDHIVIEDAGEYQYCLDLKSGAVINWSQSENDIIPKYDSFLAYFEDRLNDGIENMA